MALLEDLENEHSIIDSTFRRFCAARGISSVEDFLVQDMYELVAFAEHEADSERLKEGITQVLSIMDEMHNPWLNGLELLKDFQENKHFSSTGFGGIDFLLQGGFRQGQLTELVGPSSSGKTQICLQSAAEVARRNVGTVIYVDTSNSFSPKRISKLLNQSCTHSSVESRYQMLQNVMRNILCHSVFDIFSIFDVLHQLQCQVERGDFRIPLLIVDSMSSLVTPVLGGAGSHGHSLMVSAGFLLKKLAHEQNVAILVTNHTVGGEGGAPKPALGESWKSIPHVRLLLSRESGSQSCSIRVLKHPSLASGKAARFSIPNQAVI